MAGQEITVDQLRQLLGVQAELREQAEGRWRGAQRALVSLLETFAPEEVDRRLKNGQPLDNLGVEELAQLVGRQFNARLSQSKGIHNEDDCLRALQTLKDQLLTIQSESGKLTIENRRLIEETQALRGERDGAQSQLTALQQATAIKLQKPILSTNGHPSSESLRNESAPEPDWMVAWRNTETFEYDAAVLRLLGETGLARRPLIEKQAADLLGIRKAGGIVQSLFNRLEAQHLIEFFHSWDTGGVKTGGRSPDLARLAERGRLAYMLLTGNSPVENEYDALLARHVSPEYTLLNLQAADTLRGANYQVNPFPSDIQLPDGSLFKPDLLAIDPNGQTLYIEVEAEANKNRGQRAAKWRNALQASGGQIYVFCDNPSCMRSIRSEINFSLGRQAVQCYLTNLSDLQAGKRAAEGGGIWLDVRSNHVPS